MRRGRDQSFLHQESIGGGRFPVQEPWCVVSDLDGTLLRSDGTLSAVTTSLLSDLVHLGMPMVVATARTPRAVRKVVGHELLGTVACANGAIVWDAASDEVVSEDCFERVPLQEAVAALRAALPDVGCAFLSARSMYVDGTYLALRGKGADGVHVVPDLDRVPSDQGIAVVALRHPGYGSDELNALAATAFAGTGLASFAGATTVDVVPPAVTKAVTVARVLADAGCPLESTVAFGDMANDLPLFELVGWACAVANAHPLVLEAADEIVPSNDDDGVARTVRRLLSVPPR